MWDIIGGYNDAEVEIMGKVKSIRRAAVLYVGKHSSHVSASSISCLIVCSQQDD